MRSARTAWLFAPLLVGLFAPKQEAPGGMATSQNDQACMLCHSGATKGLRRSAHAFLLTQDPTTACQTCHQGTDDHQASARRAEDEMSAAGAVLAASCAACHPDLSYAAKTAAHPWKRKSQPAQTPTTLIDIPSSSPLPPGTLEEGFEWSGLLAVGMRLIDVSGSRDRFDSDFNLDRGLRLKEIGLRGRGSSDYLDHIEFGASDLGDPYQVVRGELSRAGLYESKARWRQSRYRYRASGDFHRVDRRDQETGADLSFDLGERLKLDADFTRRSQQGFWLTNRIGNQNLTPLTTVSGVESPHRLDSDDLRIGLSGELEQTAFSIGFSYRDESNRDRWIFSRPAQANPAFVESEDFASRSTLRGPGLDFSLSREIGPLSLDLQGRYLELDRKIRGAGNEQGFDVADFTTTTTSQTKGKSESFVLDGSALLEVSDHTDLILSWHWLDHDERLDIDQTEITVIPSLSTSTTINTTLEQRTSQRVFDGAVEIEQELHAALVVNLGYGFARESLKVPDLETGDSDFRSGRTENDGIIAGFEWRPFEHWSLRGRYSDYGQNGLQLHELAENEARSADGRLRYQRPGYWAELFTSHRQSRNDVSSHRFESNSVGISTSLQPRDDVDLFASFTYSETNSRTLTNFFFDPDPNPMPTVVGFDGDTRSFSLGFRIEPSARVHWLADANYTNTRGSFDVDLLDWRIELGVEASASSEFGVQLRQVDYEEQAGRDDFAARLVLIYWRQTFGGWR